MEFGQTSDPKRRLIGVSAVILIHVVMIWALAAGLVRKAMDVIPPPIKTKILEEAAVEDEPPPPPPPQFEAPPPAFVPPPEISIATPTSSTSAITATTKRAPPKKQSIKPPVVKAKNCREPDYPAVSERLGETGTVLLQLLVGVDGKVTQSKIEKSSGYPRLDKAAQDALSRCRFTPGEVNGVPAPAWAQLKYTFRKGR